MRGKVLWAWVFLAMLTVPLWAGLDRDQTLDRLWEQHGPAINAVLLGEIDPADEPGWAEMTQQLDEITGQKDGWASGLMWYEDLETALTVARAENKPVLSLRMLGRLDEDLSCANSRLFRLLLYPDPAVNELLCEKFVLHWQSVRPAPRLTVDYGDGRRLTRTITGNSLHYVLDSTDAGVIDVMPGLVDAATFAGWLRGAHERYEVLHAKPVNASANLQPPKSETTVWRTYGSSERDANPALAMRMAVSKSFMELPAFDAIRGGEAGEPAKFIPAANESVLISEGPTIDPRVVNLIRLKEGGDVAGKLARLRQTLRQDTALNRHQLKPMITARLADPAADVSHEALTAWIYAEVFQSPLDDLWSGLVDPAVLVGLDHGGVTQP